MHSGEAGKQRPVSRTRWWSGSLPPVRIQLLAETTGFGQVRVGEELIDLPPGACLMAHTVGMDARQEATLFYKRSRFVTHLPVAYRYSPSHAWMVQSAQGVWRVGLTKFATRMLGEIVDHGFETPPGATVKPGQVVGWIEGFKAISDIFCVGQGEFVGCNPALRSRVTLISEDPYDQGWLYEFRGEPDSQCMDVQGYRAILDDTIDRILQNQKGSEDA